MLLILIFFFVTQKFIQQNANKNHFNQKIEEEKIQNKQNRKDPNMSTNSSLKLQDLDKNVSTCKEKLDYYIKQINNKNLIDKIEIKSCKENYYCSTTRYRIVSTIFFKDGMIVKYIQEYNDGFRPYSSSKRYYMFI